MIEQQEWRAGLNDPDFDRIPNNVNNIIVHHSAGSNTDTNYYQVVRAIYIYHTEVRGWSDIGYNYLIAQDGSIFKGRDPGHLEQDNVLGAHFCSSNTGTMGICLLGDYMSISPAPAAISSLTSLITWKTGKDSLDPAGYYPHPLNEYLKVVAGHRDGCATMCPGDSVYLRLSGLRQKIREKFDSCGYFIRNVNDIQLSETILDIYITGNEIMISSDRMRNTDLSLYDITGRMVVHMRSVTIPAGIPVSGLKKGMYFIVLKNDRTYYSKKILFTGQ